jgi:DnaJ domain
MQSLLLGVLLLVVILLAGRYYVQADPARMARLMRRGGGFAALGLAGLMAFTGKALLAFPLVLLGMWLLGKKLPFGLPGGGPDDIWPGGQRSSVRTAMLEMTLDHDTGATDGRVLSGAFAGRLLSQLSHNDLTALLHECMLHDMQGAQLLRAYMERIGMQPGEAGTAGGRAPGAAGNGMTVDEAYEVLGLPRGAGAEDIHAAHRALMKKYHPDQGGTTYLAAKINQAKEVLLRQI